MTGTAVWEIDEDTGEVTGLSSYHNTSDDESEDRPVKAERGLL